MAGDPTSGDAERFWRRVDEALDARRDPLDDPAVRDELLAHPELLEDFARVTAALAAVSAAAPLAAAPADGTAAVARPRRRAAALVAVVAVVLFVVVVTAAVAMQLGGGARSQPAGPDLSDLSALPDLAPAGGVLSYRCRSYTRSAAGRISREVDATGQLSVLEREVRVSIQPRASAPHGHAIRVDLAHLRSAVRTDRLDPHP